MWTAITRDVSPALAACELSFVPRSPIDVVQAREHHAAYSRALESLGCEVIALARLRADGISVTPVDVSELQKAEGAVTCCSLLLRTAPAP